MVGALICWPYLFNFPENQKQILTFPNQVPWEKEYRNPVSAKMTEKLTLEVLQPFLGDMY